MRAVYVSAGRAQWLEACRALARLPSLQSFVLILGNSWFSEPIEKLPVFLEPLRGLRVNRPRGFSEFDRLATLEQSLAEGSSSDEESSPRFNSGSSSGFGTWPRALGASRACSCSLLSTTTSVTDIPKSEPILKSDRVQATWELRLQGQSYYMHELGRIGEDLRRRGIDCCISIA